MPMNPNLVITAFVIFQLLLFTIFLLTPKQRHRISNKILIIILLSQALWYFESSLFHWGSNIIMHFVHFLNIGESLSFLWAPGVFLYVRYLTRHDNKFNPKDILYFLPMVLHFGFLAYRYHFRPTEVKIEMIRNGVILGQTELAISWGVYCLNNIIFIVAAFFSMHRYRKSVKKNKVPSAAINYSLITIILAGFLTICLNECLRYLAFQTGRFEAVLPLYTSTLAATYILISMLIVGILKKPELFHHPEVSVKYNSSPLTPADISLFAEKLNGYMQVEKPFLNDTLSLVNLSEFLGIAPRYLSQVINQAFGQNFFDYINSYRIDHAAGLLSDQKNRKTISEIFYSSGFNSKATFYKAFKKQLNTTPTEYRQLFGTAAD